MRLNAYVPIENLAAAAMPLGQYPMIYAELMSQIVGFFCQKYLKPGSKIFYKRDGVIAFAAFAVLAAITFLPAVQAGFFDARPSQRADCRNPFARHRRAIYDADMNRPAKGTIMNTLRNLQAATFMCFCLSAGIAAAEPTGAAAARGKTSDADKIPQVIIIGKRLNAAEKAQMAREENDQKENKMISRKAPRKAAKLTRSAG